MQQRPLKIVVSGPVGAGKTTFISTLSETPVVSTDELATESIGKLKTTVAMDFGTFTVDGVPIFMFGTPGQDRFDFMWEVLSDGALGLLLLLAGDRPRDFMRARVIMDTITSRVAIPFLIGVTHLDSPAAWQPEDIADFFQVDPSCVIGVDARSQEDCLQALVQLLEFVVMQLDPQGATTTPEWQELPEP